MSAAELFSKANEAFVSEDYEEAVKLYTEAIDNDSSKDEYFCNRAQAHIKLSKFKEAENDTEKSLELNPKSTKAHLRKGIACFNQDKFDVAKEAFVKGQELDGSEKSFATWIRKCDAELNLKEKKDAGDTEASVGVSKPAAEAALSQPPVPKAKHDWYQTETHVIVTILLKNVQKEALQVDIQNSSLSVVVKLSENDEYNLQLFLAHQVVSSQSTTKLMASKIEIKLKKAEGIRWAKLEGEGKAPDVKHFNPESAPDGVTSKYPSSSHHTRDWDKLVTEIKEEEKSEKPEGDAALNQLFQQIYADGTDEVKKAMNKSFMESGGTVLSTNWKEIGTKKVDIKPPDGMEYKEY